MKVALYARESSDDTQKAPSIQSQIERGTQFIQEKNYELSKVYADNGWSGGDWRRPEWNQLVSDARARRFSIVIVWNQDRLARDTEQFLWFYRNLRERGISVYSLTEGEINMETAGDRIKHTSLAMAAEALRLITSEKVKRAYTYKKNLAEKNNRKVRWGRNNISDSIISELLRLHSENPKLTCRKLARLLPKYVLKNGKERNVSHAWVFNFLKCVKKSPLENMQQKTDGNEKVLSNDPII